MSNPSSKDVTAERYQCVGGSMYIYRDGLVNEPILFVLATDYDRMLALGETYERDYKRLLEAGTRMRVEIERLTEAVADKESDCARLHSALMDAKYPETAQVETPAPQPEAHWETPCPKREDKLHCECWYGGNECCACGDSAILDGTEHPPCSGQKTTCSGDTDAS